MRALNAEHRVLVMDEPTTSLGPVERTKLFEVIVELRRHGTAIIYISHDLDDVLRIANRISVMRNGAPGGERYQDGVDQGPHGAGDARQEPSGLRRAIGPFPLRSRFAVESLSVGRRVTDVSFSLRGGEILGIAGLVGSGRTEILRALAGAERTATGRLIVGSDTRDCPASVREHLRLGIALVPEDRKAQGLVPLLSGTPQRRDDQPAAWPRSASSAASEAGSWRSRPPVPSPSTRQRLPLPRADALRRQPAKARRRQMAASAPDRVCFSTSRRGAIDIGAKAELYGVIRRLAEGGLSVILVSSELEEVIEQSDRVVVLSRGRLISILERGGGYDESRS